MWTRFVALGDSLTEGVGDPLLNGSLRGWAALLAAGLRKVNPDLVYVNLARRSLRTKEIIAEQLPQALDLEPDLASALVGMNDLARADFDPDAFAEDLSHLVRALTDSGATVLLGTFPDISRFVLAPAPLRKALHTRLEQASNVVRSVASDDSCILVDGWNMPETRDRNIISIDRMHPNSRGHSLLARSFAEVLADRANGTIELADPPLGRVVSIESVLHLKWIALNARPALVRGLLTAVRKPRPAHPGNKV